MSGNTPLERCFKEAEETGRLNLSQKNLRDFPDPTEECELIDVIEIGELNLYKLQNIALALFKSTSFLAHKWAYCLSACNITTDLLSCRLVKK